MVVNPNTRTDIPQLLFYRTIYKLYSFLLSVLWKKMTILYVFVHSTSFHWWTVIHLIFVWQLCPVFYLKVIGSTVKSVKMNSLHHRIFI